MIRLQNVFKMSSLQDIFARHCEDVLKTSWICLEDVLKTSWRSLEDVWTRWIYWSWPRRLEDVWLIRIYSSSSRCLEDVFWRRRPKTSSSRRMFAGLVLIKLCYLITLRRHYSTTKCLFLHSFWRTEDNSSNKLDHRILTLLLLKVLIIFLLQDNAIHLSLESLKELFGFDNITCALKCRQNIYWFFNM